MSSILGYLSRPFDRSVQNEAPLNIALNIINNPRSGITDLSVTFSDLLKLGPNNGRVNLTIEKCAAH